MAAEEAELQSAQQFTDISEYRFLGDNATVENKRAFITAYREEGSIFHAAAAIRINRKTVYRWIDADEQFAEAVADSKEDTYDALETSVYKRAFKSDLLAMFYLKAHRPKFRDKVTVDLSAVQEQIDAMMQKFNLNSPQQLQPATTEFIDTDYSQSRAEYSPVDRSDSMQFSHPSANDQKEDSD